MRRSLIMVTFLSLGLVAGCTAAEPEPALTLTDQDQKSGRIETMCTAASEVLSGLANAVDGFTRKAIDEVEYAERVGDAQAQMAALLDEEHPDGAAELQAFGDAVAAVGPEPVLQIPQPVATTSTELNEKVCTPNGTELVIGAEFGG